MQPEIVQLEPRMKEILYRCLEEIRATKAALYLFKSGDLFELITQYGFKDNLPSKFKSADDIVDKLLTKRVPFYLNGLNVDPRFSELLYQADTSKILVAPIYSRGKLVGFIDLRDKAAKQDFQTDDLTNVQKVVDQYLDLFAQKGLYGQKMPSATTARTPMIEEESADGGSTAKVIEEARLLISRGLLRPAVQNRSLSEHDVNAGACVLPAILGLPGVVVVGLSAASALGGTQVLVARSLITEQAMENFQSKLKTWLQKRGDPDKITRTSVVEPFGAGGPPIESARIVSMLSAPLNLAGVKGAVLSIALEAPPDASLRTRLEKFLTQIQQTMEKSMASETLQTTNQRIAEKLLEPDFDKYPALAAHSMRVSDLAERFASFIACPPNEVEKVRLAGLVHDVGMRLLDYHRLYRKANTTADDVRIFREHCIVGAALVAESALGSDIASIVLAHHERPDGTGYPNGLVGDQIPAAARILHLCDAYDAMTAADSYQTPVVPAAALGKIKRSAGTQFDSDYALRFCEMLG